MNNDIIKEKVLSIAEEYPMKNEIDMSKNVTLYTMGNSEYSFLMQEINPSIEKSMKLPLTGISALGVAFEPLTTAIQTIVNGGGGSGIYYVNTHGKQMFQYKGSSEYLGALKTEMGKVGGGQASMTQLACSPAMLFMAAALMNIEKKLDAIQETQKEIIEFFEQKEMAKLKGNLNTLSDVLSNYKYNWDNEKYKTNKHIQIQEIKRDAEQSILLYREQIFSKIRKRSTVHSDKNVKEIMKKLQFQFRDYQLALYVYSFSTFLEMMLLENFDAAYLDSIVARIENYSYQYRSLYTECYNLLEDYSKSSVQSNILNGFTVTSKTMGEVIAKMPIVNKLHIDENLMETSGKLEKYCFQKTAQTMKQLAKSQSGVVLPFVENIKKVNKLYNEPIEFFFDKDNLYIHQIEGK